MRSMAEETGPTLNGSPRKKQLPDFLIIGAQRCGTSSLYNALIHHPHILPAVQKEIHFFDYNFAVGVAQYSKAFPSCSDGQITGEASPYYIFHPHSPRRIHETLPDAKLIVLLRDPVARAYSHYWHEVRMGVENLPFNQAVIVEGQRMMLGKVSRMDDDENYYSAAHQHFTYVARGMYAEQLALWRAYISKDNLLILRSADLFEHSSFVLAECLSFLGVPLQPLPYVRHNKLAYPPIDLKTRSYLEGRFEESNQRLRTQFEIDLSLEVPECR